MRISKKVTVTRLAFLLILASVLAGCVIIPLPDKGPALRQVGLPQIGETEQSVRERFGQPQLLDSGNFLMYEWTRDRKFVLVAAIPSGLPVGGVVREGGSACWSPWMNNAKFYGSSARSLTAPQKDLPKRIASIVPRT